MSWTNKIVSGLILLLSVGMLVSVINANDVKIESTTITVPSDFPTIQGAINHANSGDIIYVKTGTYLENIVVNKTLSLIGENRETTIIDGRGLDVALKIVADNVTISGFTVRSGAAQRGMVPVSVKGCYISTNIMEYCMDGMLVASSSNNTILNNIFRNNYGDGIFISSSAKYNLFANNTIQNNGKYGMLLLSDSSNNFVLRNNVTANDWGGIIVDSSSSNLISDNVVARNNNLMYELAGGIWLDHTSANNIVETNLIQENAVGISTWFEIGLGNKFYHNNLINNTDQAYTEGTSIWDDGYPSGGNYWSDYTGVDANHDGIGDSPYIIDTNNRDNYPLMYPWGSLAPKINSVEWIPTCPYPFIPASIPRQGEPVVVRANVSDQGGELDKVVLSYRVDNSVWWNTSMSFNATNGLWTTTMPGQAGNSTPEFFIKAYNRIGQTTTSSLYSFNVKALIAGDINGDGIVNIKDAVIIATNWQKHT